MPISYNHVQNAQNVTVTVINPVVAELRTDLIPITIMPGYYSQSTIGSCQSTFFTSDPGIFNTIQVYKLGKPEKIVKIKMVDEYNKFIQENVEIDCIESSISEQKELITTLYYTCMSLSWIMLIGMAIGLLVLWLCCASWTTCVCCIKNRYHKANAVMTFT